MKVRLNDDKRICAIARMEALLAGAILTVSTAYAATVCPMYLTQLQLDAQLRERMAVAQSAMSSAEPNLLGSASVDWLHGAN